MYKNLLISNMSPYGDWMEEVRGFRNRNFYILQELRKLPGLKNILAVDYVPFDVRRQARIFLDDYMRPLDNRTSIARTPTSRSVRWDDQLVSFTTLRNGKNPAAILKDLRAVYTHLGMRPEETLLWSYNPLFTDIFTQKNTWATHAVFDTVDNWLTHASYQTPSLQTRLRSGYATIEKHADTIFTVAESLHALFPSRSDVHWMPNGVDVQNFSAARDVRKKNPPKENIVGYLGIIETRIDVQLLFDIAQKKPDIQFVFAGPVFPNARAHIAPLKKLPNVRFLGRFRSSEVSELLAGWSAGIIPHIANDFTKSMNPMKYYEYLAAGLPVVSTPVAGVAATTGVAVARTTDEWIAALDDIFAGKISAPKLTDVQQFDWSNRFAHMQPYI